MEHSYTMLTLNIQPDIETKLELAKLLAVKDPLDPLILEIQALMEKKRNLTIKFEQDEEKLELKRKAMDDLFFESFVPSHHRRRPDPQQKKPFLSTGGEESISMSVSTPANCFQHHHLNAEKRTGTLSTNCDHPRRPPIDSVSYLSLQSALNDDTTETATPRQSNSSRSIIDESSLR